MRVEKRTIYIANDGKEFVNESDAIEYERTLQNTRVFLVKHSPDSSTGEFRAEGYIICEAKWGHKMWVEDWLYQRYGSRVWFENENTPTWAWNYQEVGANKVEAQNILARLTTDDRVFKIKRGNKDGN